MTRTTVTDAESNPVASKIGSIFNAKQLADGLDMPFETARQYIEKLTTAGMLCEVTGNARNQIYRADEVFGALDNIRE